MIILCFHHNKIFLFFQVFCCFLKLIFFHDQLFNTKIQVLIIPTMIFSNSIYDMNALICHLNAHSLKNQISHPRLLFNFLNCSYLFSDEVLIIVIGFLVLFVNYELEVKAVFLKSFFLKIQEHHQTYKVVEAVFINSNGIFIFQYQSFILGSLQSLSV